MRSVAALHEVKSKKEKHIDAILDEQDRQWDEDQINHERIAVISQVSSEQTRRHAALQGIQDSEAVLS